MNNFHAMLARLTPEQKRRVTDNSHTLLSVNHLEGICYQRNENEPLVFVLARGWSYTIPTHSQPVAFLSDGTIWNLGWFFLNYTPVSEDLGERDAEAKDVHIC